MSSHSSPPVSEPQGLIEQWRQQANRCIVETNGCGDPKVHGLLCRADAYRQCADELEQALIPPAQGQSDAIREAFRAGFLAVCSPKDSSTPLGRVWAFDRNAMAADLEPEAFAAWALERGTADE